MKKMGLFWFAAALLGAALIFAGCETEAETETKYVSGEMIHLDVVVTNETELAAALEVKGGLTIGLDGAVTLSGALEIYTGEAVYILNGSKLETNGKALTVAGIVYVGVGGELDASSGNVIVTSGGISVLSEKTVAGITGVGPGTLKVATDSSVINDATPAVTVLGTDKVSISGALEFTALDSAAAVTAAFGFVNDKGTVVGTSGTLTPSAIAAVTAPTGDKKLVMSTSATDSGTAPLTIPAWLDLTTTGTLNSITGLTVNGTLSSNALLSAVATLTVNGELDATNTTSVGNTSTGVDLTVNGKAVFGGAVKIKASTEAHVAEGAVLTTAGVTLLGSGATAATLTADAGSTVNGILFPADAPITELAANAVTIDDLTIPATTTLTVAAGKTLTVAAGGTLTFTNETSRVVLLAGASLGATATSVLAAKGTTVINGSGISLTVTASTDLTAPTAFTSADTTGPNPIVLTTAATGASAVVATAYAVGNASFLINKMTSANNSTAAVESSNATPAVGVITAGVGTAVILIGKA